MTPGAFESLQAGAGTCLLLLAFAWAGLAGSGCERRARVREADLARFRELYRSGLDSDDPYVRAESLRIMERLGRRDLPGAPKKHLDDPDPMVRVAALRVLFATEDRDAEGLAMNRFTSGNAAEKRAILEAVLEYGSEGFQRRTVWRALRPNQPRALRRDAVENALIPWVQRAHRRDEDSVVQKLLVSNVQKYVRKLDPEVGGPILRLLLELGKSDAARRPVDVLETSDAPIERRRHAAQILTEARAEAALPAYRALLQKARNQGKGDRLEVPDKGLDERLVRSAVLGVTAEGDESLVDRAKSYLEEASVRRYVTVLEALRTNPAEEARLALETALVDARPRVRHRAIEWYAARDDARIETLLEIALERDFEEKGRKTLRILGRALGEEFSTDWVQRLEAPLTSAEGKRPALRLLVQVHEETDRTDVLDAIRPSLVDLAASDDRRAAAVAGYLLVQIPGALENEKIRRRVRELAYPTPRYAYLRHVVATAPSEQTEFLLRNFYAESGTPELYTIRAMAGVGLWLTRHE